LGSGDPDVKLYLFVFGVSVIAGLGLTALVRWLGRRLRILDLPDGFRKVQKQPVPRIGGLAIFLAFFVALLGGLAVYRSRVPALIPEAGDLVAMFLGAAAVLVIGLWDDVSGLRARRKLLLLSVVAVGMYAAGFRIGVVSSPLGGGVDLGYWAIAITVFWFVGCMNAMNFIDGLDGLAAGVAAFAAGTIFCANVAFGSGNVGPAAIALAGATIGFLAFNFHPASIFLGDSGSYLLGFLIACIGLRGTQKAQTVVALLIPVIALGLPVLDTALAIVRRWSKALPLSASDRHHIHHKLLRAGLSHRQAVLILYAGSFALAAFALVLSAVRDLEAAGMLLLFCLVAALAIRIIGRHEINLAKKRLQGGLWRRKVGARYRTAGHEAIERMRQASSLPLVWQAFAGAAQTLSLDRASVTLSLPDDENGICSFHWDRPADANGDAVSWTASFPLLHEGRRFGGLEVGMTVDGHPLARELPELLGLLARSLGENARRVGTSRVHRQDAPEPSRTASRLS